MKIGMTLPVMEPDLTRKDLEKWTKGAVPMNAHRPPVIEDRSTTCNLSDGKMGQP